MRYGVPYKGSKNGIAEWVYSHFPKATNFYDLFAGGCAITQIALMKSQYQNYFCNDIDGDGISLFLDAIHGKFQNETRWISREDFFRLKDSEPYVRYCWSFGNNGENYLYAEEVEPWKKALHYARVFGDLSLMEQFGIKTDGTSTDIKRNMNEYKKKYIRWYCKEALHSCLDVLELQKNLNEKIKRNSEELRVYLVDGLKKAGKRHCDVDRFLGTNGMARHYFSRSQWDFPTREVYEKLQGFLYLPRNYEEIYGLQKLLESLQSLQSLESLQRLESLQSLQRRQSLQRLQRLEVLRGDYKSVPVLPDSLIYCDIPYKNTDGYEGGFNHAEFYEWARNQRELVIISEYSMPEDFICIDSIEKPVMLNSGASLKATEKLFIPAHQKELYERIKNKVYRQLEFDF